MAHFIRILKASHLINKWAQLKQEKDIGLAGIESESGGETREKFSVRFRRKWDKFRETWLGRFFTPDTLENIIWKSFLGFVGGVLLTYVFFFFFNVGVSFSLRVTTYICGLAGVVLCLGLAFSSKVRCYVLLLLPVFFSKQGRQALMAYALFLAFTGPARNTMHNMGILSDSMTCGQEMIRRTLRQIFDMVKAPFRSLKETLKKLTEAVKEIIDSVKAFVDKIKRVIVDILKVIKKAASWLGSIVNFCNKKVGTPFQRCMKTFDDAITDCKAKLGVMDFVCHVVHLVKALCYTVKWLDFICMFTEFLSDKVIGVVKKRLREFGLHMKTLFYVSIEFSHSYEFETTASNTTRQVAKTILQKIGKKTEKIQALFSFFGFVFGFVFIFIFFKVYYYKYKFLTSDRYDNYYINKYIIELDLTRAKMNRETVLPLEPREKRKYAKATAIRLLSAEKGRIAESMFLLGLTTLKVITFMLVDYSLFWVLLTIYEAGQGTVDEIENQKFVLHVEGGGALAKFYRRLGDTFKEPSNPDMHLNPLHCLPDPVEPDTSRYIQIGFLVGLCWLLTVTEAYGLRLRNIVMSHYYPDRAKERAIWLYNHILRSRGSFVRFARRQLRKQFGGAGQPIETVTFKQRLFASFPFLAALFGKDRENNCLICGVPESEAVPLKRCKTPGCPGRFCLKCYASLENICTICQSPIEYGDLSDISEEIDSSEEEFYILRRGRGEFLDKDKTFADMETRDSFKDLEANKKLDFARVDDLDGFDNTSLKNTIKKTLEDRLKRIEATKTWEEKKKKAKYEETKNKVQKLIHKIMKNKKNENKNEEEVEEEETLLTKTNDDSEKLKKEIKDRIEYLKEKQGIRESGEEPPLIPLPKRSIKFVQFSGESESDGNTDSEKKPKTVSSAVYFVEEETERFKPVRRRFHSYYDCMREMTNDSDDFIV